MPSGRLSKARPSDVELSRMVLGPSFRGEPRRIEVEGGIVSSVCQAGSTGEIFLGFEGGRVYSFDAASGIVRCLTEELVPIASMAVDPEGRTLVLLLGDGPGPRRLVHLDRTHSATNGWARQGADDRRSRRLLAHAGDGRWLGPCPGDLERRGDDPDGRDRRPLALDEAVDVVPQATTRPPRS